MHTIKPLPCRGDFVTLETRKERSCVAVVVGFTPGGSLRLRRLLGPHASACFETVATYRGPWRELPVTDPRHPAYSPADDATLAELGL